MVLIYTSLFFFCYHITVKSFSLNPFKLKSPLLLQLKSTSRNTNDIDLDIISDVQHSLNNNKKSLIEQLTENGYAILDNFLSEKHQKILRNEAEDQYKNKRMSISKSTRWDEDLQQVVEYNKHNVYSMQLSGGEQYYEAPKLHEYLVGMVQNMHQIIMTNKEFAKEALLSPKNFANKLAVCTGSGSSYDKHYDNSGAEDLRKLTILYYLNPEWKEGNGGYFRIYNDKTNTNKYIDIEPRGDRLLVFWADRLVHSVTPSYADTDDDKRWALTLWMTTEDANAIVRDDEAVKAHFSPDANGKDQINSLNFH